MSDGYKGRGSRLAARFRSAVSRKGAEERADEQRRDEQLALGRAAREELLQDLKEVGDAIGVVKVRADEAGLSLANGDLELRFERLGEADRVRVHLPGRGKEDNQLYRQAELGGQWVWSRIRGKRETRVKLFDAGLEELLVHGLGLPRPEEHPPDATDERPPQASDRRTRKL